MSAPDRSWTIAPTLLWFGLAVTAGMYLLDGNLDALADRLTSKRDGATTTPAIGAPLVVAQADGDDGNDAETTVKVPVTGNHDLGALDDVCIEGSDDACKRWAMDGFYRAVADGKSGKLGRAVRVSWYGDSVVATDAIPGRLRTRLQTELGDGGPGFIYVVAPHRFCGHEAITRTSGGSWLTHAISTTQVADGLYGVGGSSTETDGGRATIKLVAGKATNVELYYLAQPRGGTATVTADGTEVMHATTAGATKQAGWATAAVASGATQFRISTDGRVRLFGIDLENDHGAVVDNLGIVSVNVKSFVANDVTHWRDELGHRNADLVMIMIGANEAQWLSPKDQDTKAYQSHYEKILEPIRNGRPDAACLVVSPTDQAEEKDGSYASRPVMPLLVEAQRKAAHSQGCAFYSTYAWMGGRGSAQKWFRKGLVGSDFQHLSRKGANKMADAVFDALIAGFHQYAGK